MRNFVLLVCSLVLCVTLAAAQGKISTEWKCDAKPSEQHSISVPDHEGRSYTIAQGKCTAEKGTIGDVKEQEGTFTEFGDMNMASGTDLNHGVFVETLANGDKIFYDYHGSQAWKDGKMVSGMNKWRLAGGTGMYKEAKGEGGCKGTGSPDGSSTWNCEGSYMGAK